jgi:hypothetical protein
MPVLAFLNQKGGVGKTTLATNVATALAFQKQRVLFIDADQQGSALDWSAARKGELLFPVVGLPKDTLHREIPALGESYDWVIIDGPPRVYNVAKSAIAAADIVVILASTAARVSRRSEAAIRARKWPDYDRCLQSAPPNQGNTGPDTSRADFTWCMTALDWGFDIPETTTRLMDVSAKAKENGPRYAALTTQNAAAAVERKGQKAGRG